MAPSLADLHTNAIVLAAKRKWLDARDSCFIVGLALPVPKRPAHVFDDRRPATAEDVARLAGISQSAVSRAFTEGASISEAMREKVREAAGQLGYRPNLIARSLISGRSNIVGVGIGNLENPFLASTLDMLSLSLAEAGLRLLLFTTNPRGAIETSIQEVLQYRLDALVLLATALSPTLAVQCRDARVPIVLYNRSSSEPGVSTVNGDNAHGATAIADFLLDGGHRRLAFMAGMDESSASREREEAFGAQIGRRKGPPAVRESGQFTHAGGMAAARRLLSRPDRPDAIFCANDDMAIAAIDVARSEFGLKVGQELSVVGFGDVSTARWPSFSLTTFSQPIDKMVAETMGIVAALRDGEIGAVSRVVKGELIIRDSARRPPR